MTQGGQGQSTSAGSILATYWKEHYRVTQKSTPFEQSIKQ